MIRHDLKVAWRNIIKYKLQNIVSISTLAVSMAVISIAQIILSYTYTPTICDEAEADKYYILRAFANNTDNIETADKKNYLKFCKPFGEEHYNLLYNTPGIKKIYPVDDITYYADIEFCLPDSSIRKTNMSYHHVHGKILNLNAWRSALTGEKIPILRQGEALIPEHYVERIFGNKNPIGSRLTFETYLDINTFIIKDVYKRPSMQEEVSNELLVCTTDTTEEFFHLKTSIPYCIIILEDGYTAEQIQKEADSRLASLNLMATVTPIKDFYKETNSHTVLARNITYLISISILLSAMFGFVKMQIQLFYIRKRETSLRIAHGASWMSIFRMLFLEIILILISAFGIAFILCEWLAYHLHIYLADEFDELGIQIKGTGIILIFITIILALICMILLYFVLNKMRTEQQSLTPYMHRNNGHALRNTMLGIQLIVSLFILASTLSFNKFLDVATSQFNIPDNEDFYKECIYVNTSDKEESRQLSEYLRNEAIGIKQHFATAKIMLLSAWDNYYYTTKVFEDTTIFKFYNSEIEWLLPESQCNECILLERNYYNKLKTIGNVIIEDKTVVYNGKCYPLAGIYAPLPYLEDYAMSLIDNSGSFTMDEYIVVPQKGKYKAVEENIKTKLEQISPQQVSHTVKNLHEKLFDSEKIFKAMRYGAWAVSVICFIVCIMGIWSTITIDSRSRIKETAIRRIHGAKRKDIVLMFARLYIWLISVATIISTPLIIIFTSIFSNNDTELGKSFARYIPISEIIISISMTTLMILIIIGYHINITMKKKPSDIIAKE